MKDDPIEPLSFWHIITAGAMAYKTIAKGGGGAGGPKYNIQAQTATADEIVAEANVIFAIVTAANIDYTYGNTDEVECESQKLYDTLRKDHTDFAITLPVIFRWMIQTGEYREDVLRAYLRSMVANPSIWDDHIKFLESQANYLTMLYRARRGHNNEREIREFRSSITQQLLREDAEFTEMKKSIPDEVKKMDATADVARRERLRDYLIRCQKESAADACKLPK